MDWLWKGLHFFDTILLYRVLLSCIDRRMQLVQCALCTVCSPPGCHQQLGCNMTNLEIFMQGPTDRDTQKVNKSVYNKGWLKLGNFFFRKQGMQHLTLCQAILELHFCIIYNESHHRVGWSDIALFAIFENGPNAANHSKNIREFCSSLRGACAAKFSFSKNHCDLKNKYIFWKFANTFHQRTIVKKKIQNYF